jgi:hypothetical protein
MTWCRVGKTSGHLVRELCVEHFMSVSNHLLYVQVTVHRDRFRKNNQLDA